MGSVRGRRGAFRTGVTVAAASSALFGLVASGATSSASTKPHVASAHAAKVKGGTAYWAEAPQATPNFIFPFMPINFFSVANINQFQALMYRPLYWFGTGTQPTLNTSLSLASLPTYSGGNKVVTLSLKPYKWSNGETVTAQDVLFFFNMLKADKTGWAAYTPGTIPDDIKSIVVNSPTKLTITLTGAVNSYWFTYNELSQITPMPLAWDITKPGAKAGSGGCATAPYAAIKANAKGVPTSPLAKKCDAVYKFLSKESGFNPSNPKAANNSLSSYATNPIWHVVDGPWQLSSFNTSGLAAFTPNPTYSGPVKPTIAKFVELPYTADSAEFNALLSGKLTMGYVPVNDLPSGTTKPTVVGKNNARLAAKFSLVPVYSWGINYFPYNFNSTGDGGYAGKIFKQLYFRQAFQSLVDQPVNINKIFKGYGVGTYGPVPVLPPNPFATKYEQKNPYPYKPAYAVNLLKAHGWHVVPGGTTTCAVAAKCGVPVGTPLEFTMQYVGGEAATTQEAQVEQASWAQAGIKVNLSSANFDTVIGNATPCSGSSCTWELENWEGGWLYAPDYYPSGEAIFQTGAGSNVGNYSDPRNDALIKQTNFNAKATLATWQNYLAQQLPFVWQPNQAYALYEIAKNLGGATPVNPLLGLNPETWYFTK